MLLGLLRSPLRWSGAVAVIAAAFWAARAPLPDVLVADRGDVVAVRGASGRLAVMRIAGSSDAFAVREWLAADADARTPADPSLQRWRRLRRDRLRRASRPTAPIVALPFAAEAFEEDCRRAALVVSQRTAPPSCAATAIDRTVWPRTGATALYRAGKGWETRRGLSAGLRPALGARTARRAAKAKRRQPHGPRRATRRRAREDLAPDD